MQDLGKTQMEEEHQPQLFPADEVAKQVIAVKKMRTTRDEELTVDLKQLHETQRTELLQEFTKSTVKSINRSALIAYGASHPVFLLVKRY